MICWGSGPKNGLMLIADAASKEDLKAGTYYASPEGQAYTQLFAYTINLDAYRTALFKAEGEGQEWYSFLKEEIEDVKPTAIFALGPKVFEYLTQVPAEVEGQIDKWDFIPVHYMPLTNIWSELSMNRLFAAMRRYNRGVPHYHPADEPIIHMDEVPDLASQSVIYVDCEGSEDFRWSIQITVGGLPNRSYIIRDKVLANTFKLRLLHWRPMVVFHNALYDLRVLRDQWDIDLPLMGLKLHDTMRDAQYDGGWQGLKKLSKLHLGLDMAEYKDYFAAEMKTAQRVSGPQGDLFHQNPVLVFQAGIPATWASCIRFADERKWVTYAAMDTIATCGLHRALPTPYRSGDSYVELDRAALPVLSDMEANGFTFNQAAFTKALHYLREQQGLISANLYQHGVTDLSPEGIRSYLYDTLKLPKERGTKTGKPTTDAKYLRTYIQDFPQITPILRYRQLEKLITTYFEPIPQFVRNGMLQPRWRHTIVPSGRLACENPNLLSWPVRTDLGRIARSYLEARPGHHLGSWDLDQIEARLLASESDDEKLIEIFTKGLDYHSITARDLLGAELDENGRASKEQRDPAKTVNYMVSYQGGAHKFIDLMEEQQIFTYSLPEAERLIEAWWFNYSGAANFMREKWEIAKQYGFAYGFSGRPRALPWALINGPGPLRRQHNAARRQAGNHFIQEAAAWVITRAMVRIFERFRGTPYRLILQIHDELIAEFPEGHWGKVNQIVTEELTRDANYFKVPITCAGQYGFRWSDVH